MIMGWAAVGPHDTRPRAHGLRCITCWTTHLRKPVTPRYLPRLTTDTAPPSSFDVTSVSFSNHNQGRVGPELIKASMPAPGPDSLVLVCGPPPMMNAVSGDKVMNDIPSAVGSIYIRLYLYQAVFISDCIYIRQYLYQTGYPAPYPTPHSQLCRPRTRLKASLLAS